MPALTSGRNTFKRLGDHRLEPMAAGAKIFIGAIVMRNAAGHVTKGGTVTGCIGVGRASETFDNTAGAAGDLRCEYRSGVFGQPAPFKGPAPGRSALAPQVESDAEAAICAQLGLKPGSLASS
jgi:hypothetical protein